jgi:tetratricopeptide (TPR) repeat protein
MHHRRLSMSSHLRAPLVVVSAMFVAASFPGCLVVASPAPLQVAPENSEPIETSSTVPAAAAADTSGVPTMPAEPSAEGLAALQRLSAGAQALAEGHADEALLLLETVPHGTPAEGDRHFLCGVALLQLDRLTESLDELRASAKLQPQDISTHCVLARVLRKLGDLPAAADALRDAIAIDTSNAHLHTLLGHLLLDQDDLNGAYGELLRAVELDPKEVDAHRGLGMVFTASGDPEHAEQAWRQACALSPDTALLHAGLASVLRAQGHVTDALVEYARAAELEPDNAVHAANVASTLALLGRDEASRAAFEIALQLDMEAGPQRALVHANFGDLLERLGDPDGAAGEYAAALADDPDLSSARESEGLLLLDLGDEAGARASLGKALATGGLTPEGLLQFALLSEAAGQAEGARLCAGLLADDDSGSPEVAYRRAELLVRSRDEQIRDVDAAVGILRHLLAGTGDTTGAVWNLLGEALAEQGSYARAAEAAGHAVALSDPDHPVSARYRSLREQYLANLAKH